MSVGLDIGSRTIKVIELNREGKKFALKAAGAVGYSTPVNIESLKDEKEMGNLAGVIKKLLSEARISSKDVAISLPETQVYTRLMKFPLLNDQEIASAVKWEAEEYIPIPIRDAIVEHRILERQEHSSPPQVLVLLVAVLRSQVEKYMKVLGMVNLNVVGVETELMSLVRSLAPESAPSMIIDFGAHSTDLAITRNQELFFSRSIPSAGDAFTRAVAQSMGVSQEQAEQYKRTYGLLEDQLEGKVGKSLTPIFRVVIEEIKKTIHYYQLETKGEAPTSIIVTGGSAGIPGLTVMLTKLVGLEVVMGNPFSRVAVDPSSAKSLVNYAPIYSIAVGLAMRGD